MVYVSFSLVDGLLLLYGGATLSRLTELPIPIILVRFQAATANQVGQLVQSRLAAVRCTSEKSLGYMHTSAAAQQLATSLVTYVNGAAMAHFNIARAQVSHC